MQKLAILSLLLSFFVCYLEWGGGNASFVFEMEYLILVQSGDKADSFTHPFILLPLAGQLILLFTLFQKTPSKRLVIAAMVLMGILVGMLLLVGALGRNWKVVLSTVPFLLAGWWCLRTFRG